MYRKAGLTLAGPSDELLTSVGSVAASAAGMPGDSPAPAVTTPAPHLRVAVSLAKLELPAWYLRAAPRAPAPHSSPATPCWRGRAGPAWRSRSVGREPGTEPGSPGSQGSSDRVSTVKVSFSYIKSCQH